MAFCKLCDRCAFFNDTLFDNLLSNAEYLRGKYCEGDFKSCAIFKLAQSGGHEKALEYSRPDDIFENLYKILSTDRRKVNISYIGPERRVTRHF